MAPQHKTDSSMASSNPGLYPLDHEPRTTAITTFLYCKYTKIQPQTQTTTPADSAAIVGIAYWVEITPCTCCAIPGWAFTAGRRPAGTICKVAFLSSPGRLLNNPHFGLTHVAGLTDTAPGQFSNLALHGWAKTVEHAELCRFLTKPRLLQVGFVGSGAYGAPRLLAAHASLEQGTGFSGSFCAARYRCLARRLLLGRWWCQ